MYIIFQIISLNTTKKNEIFSSFLPKDFKKTIQSNHNNIPK